MLLMMMIMMTIYTANQGICLALLRRSFSSRVKTIMMIGMMLTKIFTMYIFRFSRRQTKRPSPHFPYHRYKNTSTEGSLQRTDIVREPKELDPDAKEKRQSRIPNLLSQYDDSATKDLKKDVVINLQEVSW